MTEKQIAEEIENYYKKRTDGLAFETIVASGENTSKPHAVPTDRKIQEKDIITIDMGCKVNGYASDMTRTFFVGEVPEEVRPVYDLVLKNQTQVAEQYKDGASTRNLAKMLESDFKLYGHHLVHSLGHGVGMEIHEAPYISYNSDTQLRENMVVTNEPRHLYSGEIWRKNRRYGPSYQIWMHKFNQIWEKLYYPLKTVT